MANKTGKINLGKSNWIFFFILILFLISFVNASNQRNDNLDQKLIINVDSPPIVSSGNSSNIIVRIVNLGESNDPELRIQKISIFNQDSKLIDSFNLNKKIDSMKNDVDYVKRELSKGKMMDNLKKFNEKIQAINEKNFKRTFKVNLFEFKSPLISGDIINVSVEIKIKYNGKKSN